MSASFKEDLIYDVGLHKGEDSEFFLKKGFRVVAVEALPSLAQIARERLRAYLDSGQLVILNVAIAEKDGPLTFFENPYCSLWGTALPERAEGNKTTGQNLVQLTVQGKNFASILREYGIPYYLKVDIEGADRLCLEALKGFQSRPRYVSIEPAGASWKGLRGEFALLRALGYSRFKVVRQDTVPAQRCPFPAREGRYVDHHFEANASGLFGEEAPGEWVDESEAIRIYRSIFFKFGLVKQLSRAHIRRLLRHFVPDPGWYDTHAAVG